MKKNINGWKMKKRMFVFAILILYMKFSNGQENDTIGYIRLPLPVVQEMIIEIEEKDIIEKQNDVLQKELKAYKKLYNSEMYKNKLMQNIIDNFIFIGHQKDIQNKHLQDRLDAEEKKGFWNNRAREIIILGMLILLIK